MTRPGTRDGVGASAQRPDAAAKVRGDFVYSSDLWHDRMVWGATVRSPHPHARLLSIDAGEALALPGVHAVLTAADVPGLNRYGLERRDQPVLAEDLVRYAGEPVAVVAADTPELARRAAELVQAVYEKLPALTDPERALDSPGVHEGGNLVKHLRIRRGAVPEADVVVRGEYEVGMQDQAFLGPESCLAVPGEESGVDLFCSTQWLHIDQDQLAGCLGLPKEEVRLTLSGVGGAFGGREDLSVQAHACMLALRLGRPVKMSYGREESFSGHVHRHPARMRYEHGATRDGRLLYVKADILLDGGAYASTSAAVTGNAGCFAIGPYEVPAVEIDCRSVYTNNPPAGAMRGFGAVQVCFGHESQMDKLAAALGLDPVELRLRNTVDTGSVMATGQRVEGPAPVAELLRRVAAKPLPASGELLPGGTSNSTRADGLRRGVGYGLSVKNICKSAGYDDYGTARVRLYAQGGEVYAEVHTAAAEVGQGLVTVQAQIVRTELGVEHVTVLPADTGVGDAGTSSASRQTWMSGGAVRAACVAVRERLEERAAGRILSTAELLGDEDIDETAVFRHRRTEPLDPETGQGDAHVAYAFAAHRAVVDVDPELGSVRVVEIACAQDVGRAMNPAAVEGQMHGGIAQGLGLAVMEEVVVREGRILNPSFTDYLIPTTMDMPPTVLDILEYPRPDSPYGLTGVGEPPLLSAPAAVAAAIRAAVGGAIDRIPATPEAVARAAGRLG
ncbi:xanthine dehydrogenase family protein molybdopterin-binding subunit [Nonomuraea rhizosphaerae]|uniref:xanthine dehydrogenase family protein molybdopterin-binding subunit n=1 Tax=Nonomuraea rhizosphaerae TaxID=2665663 RepID=UPI0035589A20